MNNRFTLYKVIILLLFFFSVSVINAQCTFSKSGTWSGATSVAEPRTTTAAGVGISITTIDAIVPNRATTTISYTPNDNFNTAANNTNWTPATIAGSASLAFFFVWDTVPEAANSPASTDAGTRRFTITFSRPVKEFKLHVDRLGGYVNGGSNSSEFTFLNSNVTMTRLSGNAQFIVNTTTKKFFREIVTAGVVSDGEATADTSGAAAGSIRFSDTSGQGFSSLSFDVTGIGPEGTSATDGVELVMELCPDIVVAGNDFSSGLVNTTFTTGNIRVNDSVNGIAAAAANSTATIVGTLPAGITLNNATGIVTVANTVPEGVYTVQYQICSVSAPTVCGTARLNIVVRSDSDQDGIADVDDLDDDNDGILDSQEGLQRGSLSYATYNSPSGNTVKNIPTVNPIKTGLSTDFSLGNSTVVQSVRYVGYITVPADGDYTFYLNSDDGSSLVIDGTNVIDNDNNHSPLIKQGNKLLSAGVLYPITILYFNSGGGAKLELNYGTGTANNPIPFSAFSSFRDTDMDGVADHLDRDSDGDGCFDAIEGDENVLSSQLLSTGSINTVTTGGLGADTNNNGVPNLVNAVGTADIGSDVGQGLGVANNEFRSDCKDSDGDSVPDYLDLDKDNDGIVDCTEKGFTQDASFDDIFKLNGTAVEINPMEIRLTEAIANQSGQAFSLGKVDFAKSFQLSFDANLGNKDAEGADGIALVFQNDPRGVNATGGVGQGIGAAGIANGLVLELDTFNNGGLGDIANDHGQIWDSDNQAGAGLLTVARDLGNLEDGLYHPVVVSWSLATKTLSYTVDGKNAGSYTFPTATPITSYFAGADKVYFGYTASTGGSNNDQRIRFTDFCSQLPTERDLDGDGISNYLDVDSDGDGCPDAVEGSENVKIAQVVSLTDAFRPGQIKVTADGVTIGSPTTIVNPANGVPMLVNNAANNPSGVGAGVADNTDGSADLGQGNGISKDGTVKDIDCTRCFKPAISPGTGGAASMHGITALGRAGADNGNWPMKVTGAYTVLDAKTKGFVINRVAFTGTSNLPDGISQANSVKGMMVYDTTNNCLKIYDGVVWSCYNSQTCDTPNQ